MKNYIIIDKSIKDYSTGKNKNEDIFVLGCIKVCSNFRNGISNITQNKLSEKAKVPASTIENIIKRLKATELIEIETKQIGSKKKNTYKFNLKPKNFFFVDTSFFWLEIDPKLKGLLLLIKSLCINNTNVVLYNKTKISILLKQDRGTVSKMIDKLIELGLLLKIKNRYVLPANYFPFYSKTKKSKHEYEKINEYDEFVLNSILNLCKAQGAILFVDNPEKLKSIFAKFPFTKKDINGVDEKFLQANYLPEVLRKRCPNLPHKINSLDYFLAILNIENRPAMNHDENIIL